MWRLTSGFVLTLAWGHGLPTLDAADAPSWQVQNVTIRSMAGNHANTVCVTADGKYAVAVDEHGFMAAMDLRNPDQKPVVKKILFAQTVAPAADPAAVWAGGWDGRIYRVKVPTLEAIDMGPISRDHVERLSDHIERLAELENGFLLALTDDRQARVLRLGPKRPEVVMTIPDVWAWAATRPVGAELVYLERNFESSGSSILEPAALKIGKASLGLDLGVRVPGGEVGRTVSASPDGTRWLVRVGHKDGEYRLRTDPAGKGDVLLPLRGRVARSSAQAEVVFAADDDGVYAYDVAAKNLSRVIEPKSFRGAPEGLAVTPDGKTCVVMYAELSGCFAIIRRTGRPK